MRSGFSLLECLAAGFLLTLIVQFCFLPIENVGRASSQSETRTHALQLAQARLRSLTYKNVADGSETVTETWTTGGVAQSRDFRCTTRSVAEGARLKKVYLQVGWTESNRDRVVQLESALVNLEDVP